MTELWSVKRDRRLAVSQAVHWTLPGLMAINNLWRQDPPALKARVVHARDVITVPTVVALSPVAAHFLPRLRALAAARGGSVRVVSVPLPIPSHGWILRGFSTTTSCISAATRLATECISARSG
jgi:hypothetical protein